jgi:anti-sigma B factor antagonist
MMTGWFAPPALNLVRLPGEFGPILRCYGELSQATAEILRKELALLEPLGHPVLTLDISGCGFLDVDGIMTLLHTYKHLRGGGRRMVLVAGTGATARLLQVTGIERIIPTFPTEQVATLALRGEGPPEPAPATWAEARAATVARWRAIQETLDQESPEEVLRQLTSMFALCERSEELYQESDAPATSRCQFCPLFYALGGRSQDVGCRSALDPLLAVVRAGDRDAARAQVAAMIRTLEEMPLPENLAV